MESVLMGKAEPRTEAEFEAAIDALLEEMHRLEQQMVAQRADIDRLTAESRAIGSHTDAKIASILQQLVALQSRGR